MSELYLEYLNEIEKRKLSGLSPKPIDSEELTNIIISQILDLKSDYRNQSLMFFTYNILPGTTKAAYAKANFLKNIIEKEVEIPEISQKFALELLSSMKGGPSIKVLLDLALGNSNDIATKAGEVLKSQVFLYEADINRLKKSYLEENKIAKDILISYSKAEFFTELPEIPEEIKVVTYVA